MLKTLSTINAKKIIIIILIIIMIIIIIVSRRVTINGYAIDLITTS